MWTCISLSEFTIIRIVKNLHLQITHILRLAKFRKFHTSEKYSRPQVLKILNDNIL